MCSLDFLNSFSSFFFYHSFWLFTSCSPTEETSSCSLSALLKFICWYPCFVCQKFSESGSGILINHRDLNLWKTQTAATIFSSLSLLLQYCAGVTSKLHQPFCCGCDWKPGIWMQTRCQNLWVWMTDWNNCTARKEAWNTESKRCENGPFIIESVAASVQVR